MTPQRRRVLACVLAALAPTPALAHGKLGPVTPVRPVPADLWVRYGARRTSLRALLEGKTSAVQLMFAGCSSVCPMQGALFAAVQRELGAMPAVHLLSLSIDALGDDAAALAAWLKRFAAQPGWRAAALESADLAVLQSLMDASGNDPAGHSAAVYFFDTNACLVWRTNDLPGTSEVVATLRRLAPSAA